MPSDDLLLYFQRHVRVVEHRQMPGWHYQLTSEAWLQNMDRNKPELVPALARTRGSPPKRCAGGCIGVCFSWLAKLWGYAGGREWLVSHYLFEKR